MNIDPNWITSILLFVIGAFLIAICVLALLLIESKRAKARIEATLETGILYRPEQGNATHVLWMRPAAAFDELVDTDQGKVCRFLPV